MINHVKKFKAFYDYEVQRRWGLLYKIDHCFKPAKHLYREGGTPIFNALFTGLNEYGEIRMNSFSFGTTKDETSGSLKALKNSLLANGQSMPTHFYTDICCSDRGMLEDTFPSLKAQLVRSSPLPLPKITFITIDIKSNIQAINAMLMELYQWLNRNESDFVPIGLDTEWNITYEKEKTVDVIQLAYCLNDTERLFVLQLKSQTLPSVLVQILTHSKLLCVGNYVTIDIDRINCVFLKDVTDKMDPTRSVNLCSIPTIREAFGKSRVSLESICEHFLGYALPKEERMNTNWKSTLTESQIEYAARDAWCSLIVFLKVTARNCNATGLNTIPMSAGTDEPTETILLEPEAKQHCRVHLDPLHAMMRITKPISRMHPLANAFSVCLRDAIFKLNQNDVGVVKSSLKKHQCSFTFEDKERFDPDWVQKRVRRSIVPPQVESLEIER